MSHGLRREDVSLEMVRKEYDSDRLDRNHEWDIDVTAGEEGGESKVAASLWRQRHSLQVLR